MRTYREAAHFNKAQVFPVFPIDPSVANVFPLVPCVPPFSPCVSQLFLVFRVCNLWQITSRRANTIYKETVSIVYSVPSSLCVPSCVLPMCSLLFTWFPVPSVFPTVSRSLFPIVLNMFRVCSLCFLIVPCVPSV